MSTTIVQNELLTSSPGLETIACDLCGSQQFKTRYTKPDQHSPSDFEYSVVECQNCHMVFLNPRPPESAMVDHYTDHYHNDRNTAYFQKRYLKQLEFMPLGSQDKLLDIGCARGDFLAAVKAQYPGISTYGNDPFSSGVSHDFIEFSNRFLPEAGYPYNFFDCISAWAVFEHLHYPRAYFEEIGRILAPQGKFIMLVTNADSLYGKKAYREDIPRHLFHFSPRTVEAYAQQAGLKVSKIHFNDDIYDGRGIGTFKYSLSKLAGMSFREAHVGKPKKRLHKIAFRLGVRLDKLLFASHWESRLGCSGIMIVEFTKP